MASVLQDLFADASSGARNLESFVELIDEITQRSQRRDVAHLDVEEVTVAVDQSDEDRQTHGRDARASQVAVAVEVRVVAYEFLDGASDQLLCGQWLVRLVGVLEEDAGKQVAGLEIPRRDDRVDPGVARHGEERRQDDLVRGDRAIG